MERRDENNTKPIRRNRVEKFTKKPNQRLMEDVGPIKDREMLDR